MSPVVPGLSCLQDWPQPGAAADGLRREWTDLLAAADGVGVFQSWEWQQSWWQAFGAGHRLNLLLLRDAGGALRAIAPLMLLEDRRWGLSRRRLMLIGTPNHAADYADLIVHRDHPQARRVLLDGIAAGQGDWTEVELRNLPEASSTLALLRAGCRFPSFLLQCTAEAPARVLGDRCADLRTANKKSLRRHANGFRREGELAWRRLASAQEIAAHLEPFFDQHVARWAGSASPSLFLDPRQRVFYRHLAESLGASGALHFSVLVFQRRPIAYHFGFERRGVLTWYKPSFDPALGARSPGEVLIKSLLEHAIARDLREVDFTIGSEPFKFRFANRVRRVFRVRAWRRPWERLPAQGRELVARALAAARRPRAAVVSGSPIASSSLD